MKLPHTLTSITEPRRPLVLDAIATAVLASGLLTIIGVLFAESHFKQAPIVAADAHFTLLIGLTFVYLASLLRRGKYNAWLIALPLYVYIVTRNTRHFFYDLPARDVRLLPTMLNIVIPGAVLFGLIYYRRLFNVRSEIRSFVSALRNAAVVLLAFFLFGVVGFQLLDNKDFHQEITLLAGAHYTVDQFGLTTDKQVVAHSKRARLFLDSLGFAGVGALFYMGAAFFAPIRFRLVTQPHDQEQMLKLLDSSAGSSEDFFKLWPQDKAYFFTPDGSAGLAYKAVHGVALIVGDPVGKQTNFNLLLQQFSSACRVNDWEPALVHTQPVYSDMYERLGFDQQKIGQEAIVDIAHFSVSVAKNKYFRNIANRFEAKNYTCEVLSPPYNDAVLRRLKEISDDWLKGPGRAERGFMMGYYSDVYMQQCILMVVCDAAGTMQGFINQVPVFKHTEANFDFLRHTKSSLGNINDYLMINFIAHLKTQGYKQLNMGLAPLAGLEAGDGLERTALDSALGLVYSAGGRFYSFQGLKRFKSKYEPQWQDRYIVYRGGLPGFVRTSNALVSAMRVRRLR